ncbi:MAG TPA: SAM-dependent methyltransferase, partial [Myxococcota bacterium]|nr:SAM-dependent methyltransferase [Myxococcota bacterium]
MTEYSLPCKHVSHTAWLVAAFRAQESKREDAHFRDPLAAKLLGDLEDQYLVRFSKELRNDPWILTVRTYFMDALIEKSIDQGIRTILNLGAGLDTRPYRLALPAHVRWFEADYPEVVSYKNEKLKNDKARCML